jgi:hypothetical protein
MTESSPVGYYPSIYNEDILTQSPSIIITNDTVEEVSRTFPDINHTEENPKIFNNLIDGLANAKEYSTVLVDMVCHMFEMSRTCSSANKAKIIIREGEMLIGERYQVNTIKLK